MISAILSLMFGILAFRGSVPILFPIVGLALGANCLIKVKKQPATDKKDIKLFSILGMVICSSAIIISFLGITLDV